MSSAWNRSSMRTGETPEHAVPEAPSSTLSASASDFVPGQAYGQSNLSVRAREFVPAGGPPPWRQALSARAKEFIPRSAQPGMWSAPVGGAPGMASSAAGQLVHTHWGAAPTGAAAAAAVPAFQRGLNPEAQEFRPAAASTAPPPKDDAAPARAAGEHAWNPAYCDDEKSPSSSGFERTQASSPPAAQGQGTATASAASATRSGTSWASAARSVIAGQAPSPAEARQRPSQPWTRPAGPQQSQEPASAPAGHRAEEASAAAAAGGGAGEAAATAPRRQAGWRQSGSAGSEATAGGQKVAAPAPAVDEATAGGQKAAAPAPAVDEAEYPRLGALPRKVAVRKGGSAQQAEVRVPEERKESQEKEEAEETVQPRQLGEEREEQEEEEQEEEEQEEEEQEEEEEGQNEDDAAGHKTLLEESKVVGPVSSVERGGKHQEEQAMGGHSKPDTGSVGSEESTEAGREEVQDSGEEKLQKEEDPWGTPQRPWRSDSVEDPELLSSQRGGSCADRRLSSLSTLSSLEGLPLASQGQPDKNGGASPKQQRSSALGLEELLRWRFSALAEGLRDEAVVHLVATTLGGGHGAEDEPRARSEGTGGTWREDAAQAQKEAAARAGRGGEGGSAKSSRGSRRSEEVPAKPVKPLEVSPTSWVAHQARRREGQDAEEDVEVVRAMKLILNKLTIEKFGTLYQQLIGCGIRRAGHVEILMREVFEKATTQHHFIGMYAELCAQLHKWFTENQGGEDGKTFKRILLNRCQLSFEETLKPHDVTGLEPERQEEADQLHKTRMLGNLRLVGALLEKGMLASRILVAVVDELLATPTAASLECLSVFLTAVGPTFDRPTWNYHMHLHAAFRKVQELAGSKDTPARIRFLLKDVLDLRASNWENKKKAVQTGKGPMKLSDVHRQAEEELGEKLTQLSRPGGGSACSSPFFPAGERSSQASPLRPLPLQAPRTPQASPTAAATTATAAAVGASPASQHFDLEAFREEVTKTVAELRESLDPKLAQERLAALALPPQHQAAQLTDLLALFAEEGKPDVRKAGFSVVALLFLSGAWRRASLSPGLSKFFNDVYADLVLDVPALPKIIKEELSPTLQGLVVTGLLESEFRDRLVATASTRA